MPRERRPFNRSVIAANTTFIDKTQTAVNFLMTIYEGSNVNVVNIVTAQADGDKETLIDYLNAVKEFCESMIKDVKDA